jgi:hypothetical protein
MRENLAWHNNPKQSKSKSNRQYRCGMAALRYQRCRYDGNIVANRMPLQICVSVKQAYIDIEMRSINNGVETFYSLRNYINGIYDWNGNMATVVRFTVYHLFFKTMKRGGWNWIVVVVLKRGKNH